MKAAGARLRPRWTRPPHPHRHHPRGSCPGRPGCRRRTRHPRRRRHPPRRPPRGRHPPRLPPERRHQRRPPRRHPPRPRPRHRHRPRRREIARGETGSLQRTFGFASRSCARAARGSAPRPRPDPPPGRTETGKTARSSLFDRASAALETLQSSRSPRAPPTAAGRSSPAWRRAPRASSPPSRGATRRNRVPRRGSCLAWSSRRGSTW